MSFHIRRSLNFYLFFYSKLYNIFLGKHRRATFATWHFSKLFAWFSKLFTYFVAKIYHFSFLFLNFISLMIRITHILKTYFVWKCIACPNYI